MKPTAGPSLHVSIPFKRESISKEGRLRKRCIQTTYFVSIPFKRESISKGGDSQDIASGIDRVSIPFKRESISKEITMNSEVK